MPDGPLRRFAPSEAAGTGWEQHYTPDPSGIGTIHYERHGTYSEYITLAEAQRRGIH